MFSLMPCRDSGAYWIPAIFSPARIIKVSPNYHTIFDGHDSGKKRKDVRIIRWRERKRNLFEE